MNAKKTLRRLRALERINSDISMYQKCPAGTDFTTPSGTFSAEQKLNKALEARNGLLSKPGMPR